MDFLRKHQTVILWGLLVFFLLSIAIGFGGNFMIKNSPTDAIATVDGDDISIRKFNLHYERAMAQAKPDAVMDKAAIQQKQQEVLRDLIQAQVFQKQSRLYGIQVPDAQVVNSIMSIPQFHNDKGAFDPQLYARFLQYQARASAGDFEEEQRQSIAFFKLRYMIQSCVKVTDNEFNREYALHGAEFAKANAIETSADGKTKHARTPEQLRALFRQKMIEDKSLWALNQWFTQIGQKLRVKTYLDRLQGGS